MASVQNLCLSAYGQRQTPLRLEIAANFRSMRLGRPRFSIGSPEERSLRVLQRQSLTDGRDRWRQVHGPGPATLAFRGRESPGVVKQVPLFNTAELLRPAAGLAEHRQRIAEILIRLGDKTLDFRVGYVGFIAPLGAGPILTPLKGEAAM